MNDAIAVVVEAVALLSITLILLAITALIVAALFTLLRDVIRGKRSL